MCWRSAARTDPAVSPRVRAAGARRGFPSSPWCCTPCSESSCGASSATWRADSEGRWVRRASAAATLPGLEAAWPAACPPAPAACSLRRLQPRQLLADAALRVARPPPGRSGSPTRPRKHRSSPLGSSGCRTSSRLTAPPSGPRRPCTSGSFGPPVTRPRPRPPAGPARSPARATAAPSGRPRRRPEQRCLQRKAVASMERQNGLRPGSAAAASSPRAETPGAGASGRP
mmetsp:Transcript_15455/g.43962  ORF Transcript_15455/g.43962 Transcript_15455/m.43962 type:complete len:229 (-) Transcript_15455:229-915(-)